MFSFVGQVASNSSTNILSSCAIDQGVEDAHRLPLKCKARHVERDDPFGALWDATHRFVYVCRLVSQFAHERCVTSTGYRAVVAGEAGPMLVGETVGVSRKSPKIGLGHVHSAQNGK